MREKFLESAEAGRITTGEYATQRGSRFGAFLVSCPISGQKLKIMASDGGSGVEWEHVSVSTRTRCPTWDEMNWCKSLFWRDDECVMQLHPARSQYVNNHEFCLHLWKPIGVEIPVPPLIAV